MLLSLCLLSAPCGAARDEGAGHEKDRFAIQEPVPAPLDAALSEMDSTAFALLTSLTMTKKEACQALDFAQAGLPRH